LPHALVATLATGAPPGDGTAALAACSGCGVCDAVCPSALSPRALVTATRDRLRAGGMAAPATTVRAGLDRAWLTARLGLLPYDRVPKVAFA
jgi:Fe-S oxidoreductase